MRSSRVFAAAIVWTAASAWTASAQAQAQTQAQRTTQAQGFDVERLYPSAPGGGWVVMDDLTMRGGIGGAMSLSLDYAHAPLRIAATDGPQRLTLVSDDAFVDFGFAATYGRWRLYLNLDAPLVIAGDGGTIGNTTFTAPPVDLGSNPDTLGDARVGVDVRLVGDARSPFRLGAGAQLIVPSDGRSDYDSDETYRAMGRILAAGEAGGGGLFTYAAQLGVHVRPLDDAATPGSPRGSELLFGAAGGLKLPIDNGGTVAVIGPEVFGETALRSFFGETTTGVEGLLSGRVEGTADDGPQLRVKLAGGGGLDAHFGAPEWRVFVGVEVFDHHGDRDGDGVSDSVDACPDAPGVKTSVRATSGCPAP